MGPLSSSSGSRTMVSASTRIGRISIGLTRVIFALFWRGLAPFCRDFWLAWRTRFAVPLCEAKQPAGRLQQLFAAVPVRRRPPAGQQLLGIPDETGKVTLLTQQVDVADQAIALRQDDVGFLLGALLTCGSAPRCGVSGNFAGWHGQPRK